MKNERHSKILELVKNYDIETQEELTDRLRYCGINVTQATVSRDIKELRLTKVLSRDGSYVYSVPKDVNSNFTAKLKRVFRESVLTIDFASNIVVIKTLSGMASAAAAALDSLNLEEVVGSIAGDDTIMVIIRNEKSAGQFVQKVNEILKSD